MRLVGYIYPVSHSHRAERRLRMYETKRREYADRRGNDNRLENVIKLGASEFVHFKYR